MNLPSWRETLTVTLPHNTGNPAGPRQTLPCPVLGVLVTDRFYYLCSSGQRSLIPRPTLQFLLV